MNIGNDWDALLQKEWNCPYFLKLQQFLQTEYAKKNIFPPKEEVYSALKMTSFAATKVVILGQDPYHEVGQANGLAFSVKKGIALPPSLKNIYKELAGDAALVPTFTPPSHGDLSAWARQGVLLLNTVLTVEEGHADSHQKKGWECFTDRVISLLNQKTTPVIFLLWGAKAQKKAQLITNPIHVKLLSAHPSPLSAYRGFFGSGIFSETNRILQSFGQTPIYWNLPE